MAEDALGFATKAVILRGLLGKSGDWKKSNHYREAAIQIDKLDRMAAAFSKKYRLAPLGMPADKLRRTQGPELHRLTQQSKHMDSIMVKLVEDVLFGRFRTALKGTDKKKNLPAACKHVVRSFNKAIHVQTQKARLQLPSAAEVKKLTE